MTRREQDARLLRMVKLRASGLSLSRVGKELGVSSANVATMTNKVMDADIAHSGPEVAGAYWARR